MTALPASSDGAIAQLASPHDRDHLTLADNYAVASVSFQNRFGRLPLAPRDPAATVNDLIFSRMIDPNWSSFERDFVDKERSKLRAKRLFPALRIPETLLVIAMEDVLSVDHLYVLLRPYAGTDVIAKPTHASGATVFMRDVNSPTDLRELYQLAARDYSLSLREMQYWQLPRKIIVEKIVRTSSGSLPDDYKFHCVAGKPLVYQVDHNRFGARWSRMFRVPGLEPMHANDGLETSDTFVSAEPERLEMMISACRAIAASFDYVRVDLYDGSDGVYFGEMTFTPAASLGVAPSAAGATYPSETHDIYSRIIMDAYARRALAD